MAVEIWLNNDFSNPFYMNGFSIDFLSNEPTILLDSIYSYPSYGYTQLGTYNVSALITSGSNWSALGIMPQTVTGVPTYEGSEYTNSGTVTLYADQGTFSELSWSDGPFSITIKLDATRAFSDLDGHGIGATIGSQALVHGSQGNDTLRMTDFAEGVYGDAGDDVIYGRGGDDILFGGYGNNTLYGGDGSDKLYGGESFDDKASLYGGAGDDMLYGGYGTVFFEGGAGADTYYGGGSGNTYRIDQFDTIVVSEYDAGNGNVVEAIFSYIAPIGIDNVRLLGAGNVDATGNNWSNELWGNSGNNVLRGLGSDDYIYGGSGDDRLEGGSFRDELYGGGGADVFAFRNSDWNHADRVRDFARTEGDRVCLDREYFSKLKSSGVLKRKYFDSGDSKADDKNDFIVYKKSKGRLLYDEDGSGKKGAELIAKFDGAPKLKAADIDII